MHTTELKEKVESLAVREPTTPTTAVTVHSLPLQEEKKIIEAQQDQIELLQEKLSQVKTTGGREGEGATEPALPGETAATTETDAAVDGSHSEAPVIPPAPPPPPIDGVPMAPTFGMCTMERAPTVNGSSYYAQFPRHHPLEEG